MGRTIDAKLLMRSDTSENWSRANPVLAKGQIGFDTTVKKHKIGDGVTHWQNLQYFVLQLDLNSKITYEINTTDGWAHRLPFVAQKGVFYIYTDRETITEGDKIINVAGVKIGDGTSYMVDLPFVTVTQKQREFWNNKVRCYINSYVPENLVFTTN